MRVRRAAVHQPSGDAYARIVRLHENIHTCVVGSSRTIRTSNISLSLQLHCYFYNLILSRAHFHFFWTTSNWGSSVTVSRALRRCQPRETGGSMSFGYCVNDVLALIQLSWSAVEGARRACGKHDDLTKEVSSLYDVLAHVYSEMSVPESPIGQARRSLRRSPSQTAKIKIWPSSDRGCPRIPPQFRCRFA
jgi:hypothetical protein